MAEAGERHHACRPTLPGPALHEGTRDPSILEERRQLIGGRQAEERHHRVPTNERRRRLDLRLEVERTDRPAPVGSARPDTIDPRCAAGP